MANPGWTRTESPFHAGELAIQARLGAKERMDKQGRRVIREYLPEQHRQFFAQLPYLIVGTVDSSGNPWASILVGEPGFLSSPNDRTLRTAEMIWEGAEISTYAGAERLLRFHLARGYWVEGSLPLRWSKPEFSPYLERMGAW